jgi:hypothetical protein
MGGVMRICDDHAGGKRLAFCLDSTFCDLVLMPREVLRHARCSSEDFVLAAEKQIAVRKLCWFAGHDPKPYRLEG